MQNLNISNIMQFYESEVNMTTGEKNELKKLQRKKEVRRHV